MVKILFWLALAAAPTPEAEALGRRLAQAGTLASIAPVLIEKDIAELQKEHAELNADEQAQLRTVARRVGNEGLDRLTSALGHAYAEKLSLADLRVLVAAAKSPAAARRRAAEPGVLIAATSAVGKIDLKADALTAFCRETGKVCPTP